MKYLIFTLFVGLLVAFVVPAKNDLVKTAVKNSVITTASEIQPHVTDTLEKAGVDQGAEVVTYAKTLLGTPYLYGSMDPSKGLDCSGFVNAVSKHFGVAVPRSSVDFTTAGKGVDLPAARPGDIILFTGTDPSSDRVGHIGIITNNQAGEIEFIHSSSGKANGVTISELDGYYETRFVKVIRIFQSDSSQSAA